MSSKEVLKTVPRAIRVIRRLSTASLAEGLSLLHLRVLVLVQEGMGQTQMAETLQISVAAISKTVQSLVVKGLVERLPGKDRRSLRLKLTAQGKKSLTIVSKIVEEKLEQGMKGLSGVEKKKLQEGLMVLNKLVDIMAEVK